MIAHSIVDPYITLNLYLRLISLKMQWRHTLNSYERFPIWTAACQNSKPIIPDFTLYHLIPTIPIWIKLPTTNQPDEVHSLHEFALASQNWHIPSDCLPHLKPHHRIDDGADCREAHISSFILVVIPAPIGLRPTHDCSNEGRTWTLRTTATLRLPRTRPKSISLLPYTCLTTSTTHTKFSRRTSCVSAARPHHRRLHRPLTVVYSCCVLSRKQTSTNIYTATAHTWEKVVPVHFVVTQVKYEARRVLGRAHTFDENVTLVLGTMPTLIFRQEIRNKAVSSGCRTRNVS